MKIRKVQIKKAKRISWKRMSLDTFADILLAKSEKW